MTSYVFEAYLAGSFDTLQFTYLSSEYPKRVHMKIYHRLSEPPKPDK